MSVLSIPTPSREIRPVLETITPDRAIELLERNTCNRSVRDAKVKRFADDMHHGRWQVSQDGIAISADGVLLNGQHRLYAVIEADTSIDALVIYNMSDDAMAIMDTGTARTAADYLGPGGLGEKNAGNLAAVIRLILVYTDGNPINSSADKIVSNSRLVEGLAQFPEARHSVEIAARVARKVDMAPRVVGFCHWLIANTAGIASADLFFETLHSLAGEEKGSPILALDSRLREIRRSGKKPNLITMVNLVIRAWNAWATGRTLATLPLQVNGEVPAVQRFNRKG